MNTAYVWLIQSGAWMARAWMSAKEGDWVSAGRRYGFAHQLYDDAHNLMAQLREIERRP